MVASRADRRGVAGACAVPIIEVGVPGWPSWLDRFRDYTEVIAARRAAQAAARLAPGLVWERWSLFSDAGRRLHARGVPWILEVNAPLCLERARYERLRRPAWAEGWQREILQAAPRIVAVSRWLCGWLRDGIGCRGDVRHLPNGVRAAAGDREGTRARLGISDRFVIGFVGSMKPWHGVEQLPALLDRFPDAVGLCAGDGPVALSHPRLIRLGHLPEHRLPDIVAAMDVGLAPYGPDAPPWFCPLKILDYRAQGTPVVAPDLGDCRLLVGEGGTITGDWAAGIDHWRGRPRPAPMIRGWDRVVAEGLAE